MTQGMVSLDSEDSDMTSALLLVSVHEQAGLCLTWTEKGNIDRFSCEDSERLSLIAK